MLERIARAVRRRPVRVVEALVVVGAAVGVSVEPEARDAIVTLAATLLPALVGGEVAQTRTCSRDFVEDELLDAETDGPPGSHLHDGGS